MKILMVAVFNPNSTNVSQADGFETCGAEVIRYDYRKYAEEFGSLWERDSHLFRTINNESPDIVFFSKCNDVHWSVVEGCKQVGAISVLWYMDPMGNFDPELIYKIKKCDLVFCALWKPFEAAKKINPNTYFLHEGYDHTCNYPMDVPKKHMVSFIGSLRGHRQDYFDKLRFTLIQDSYGVKHSQAVSETVINLNFTEGGTSDRTYKVLASKGFLLTEAWPEMERDFKDKHDLVVFNGHKDLKDKIDYYTEAKYERLKIALQGYNTVQKFSRINFAKAILDKCSEITK